MIRILSKIQNIPPFVEISEWYLKEGDIKFQKKDVLVKILDFA